MQVFTSSNRSRATHSDRCQANSGFSLLETIIALLILTIGLLGVASSIGYALMVSNRGRGVTNAKLLVVSALEQMDTLRDSGQLNFAEISAVAQPSPSTFTGFSTGFVPVSTTPGPDFVFGTADDPGRTNPAFAVAGVTRKIEIEDVTATLKRIKVTLRYTDLKLNGTTRELTCTSYLNDDSHGNYIP